jgi:putative FmdB family regulatory protein
MESEKYRCNRCGEIFEIKKLSQTSELACPRCYSEDLSEYYVCSLEIVPPPWEYQCQQCGVRFRVTTPRGPDEAKEIRCPACRSKNIKWLVLASMACATGG